MSFFQRTALRAAVIGSSGGIGRAFAAALSAQPAISRLYRYSRSQRGDDTGDTQWIDLEQEASIEAAAAAIPADAGLDLVIVASGLLHDRDMQPEKSLRQCTPQQLTRAFAVNSIGPLLVAKHFLPRMHRDRPVIFAALSARVGSIEDNRLGGWHAYRASKAALNMLLRNIAIEATRSRPQSIVVGLHPGTVDSALSAPFQRALVPGQLMPAERSAAELLRVIDGLRPEHSGGLFAWDGQPIPF